MEFFFSIFDTLNAIIFMIVTAWVWVLIAILWGALILIGGAILFFYTYVTDSYFSSDDLFVGLTSSILNGFSKASDVVVWFWEFGHEQSIISFFIWISLWAYAQKE